MKTDNIGVSVVIPLYNKAEVVESSLLSVVNQTVKPYEVIIVNDGSEDNGLAVVNDFFAKYKNIKSTVLSQENSGVSKARNLGISHSSCEYVALLDADDQWDKVFLEEMTSLIEEFPDASIYSSFHKIKDFDGNFFEPGSVLPKGFKGYIKDYSVVARKMPILNSSKVILKKSSFLMVGGFPQGAVLTEDLFFWFKMSLNNRFCFLNLPLAIINQFPDASRVSRINKTPYIIDYYSGNSEEFMSLTIHQKKYLFSVFFKHLLGSLKEGSYKEAFYRFKAGFKLFKIKSLVLVPVFFIPPIIYRLLRAIKRKLLTYGS